MTKFTENGKRKLQEAEMQLLDAGFNSVWQKVQERFPYDTVYSYWVNLASGKSVMLVLLQNAHLSDSLRVYELNQVKLSEAIGQTLESASAVDSFPPHATSEAVSK